MAARPSIVLLEHPRSPLDHGHYLARHLLEAWRKKGGSVTRCSDPAGLPAADALFVHVDLSVLPASYRNVAGKFAAAINPGIVDIRKRSLSLNQLSAGDGFEGPVIIKSSLNYAGGPEQRTAIPREPVARFAFRARRKWRALLKRGTSRLPLRFRSLAITSKNDYLVLPSARDVPASWFARTDLVIERFTPEMHEGLYVLREWYFLGAAEFLRTETASYPIITSGDYRPDLAREVPANLRQLRRQWKIDFGKIDYVMHHGSALVFDVNKTPSFPGPPETESAQRLLAALAPGLDSFLP